MISTDTSSLPDHDRWNRCVADDNKLNAINRWQLGRVLCSFQSNISLVAIYCSKKMSRVVRQMPTELDWNLNHNKDHPDSLRVWDYMMKSFNFASNKAKHYRLDILLAFGPLISRSNLM